jgi:hypothetical protein
MSRVQKGVMQVTYVPSPSFNQVLAQPFEVRPSVVEIPRAVIARLEEADI